MCLQGMLKGVIESVIEVVTQGAGRVMTNEKRLMIQRPTFSIAPMGVVSARIEGVFAPSAVLGLA